MLRCEGEPPLVGALLLHVMGKSDLVLESSKIIAGEGIMKAGRVLKRLSGILVFFLAVGGLAYAAQSGGRPQTAKATFAGGCFWCMEPPYDELEGFVV